MGRLNMKEWISQTIQRKETIAIPIMTHPGIEFIGKTVHDAVTNGQVHYEAIKALCGGGRNRHHGSDGRSGSFRGRDYLSGK
jgi:hypothetical protein